MQVTVIGAGLAGCEAAYQLAKRGIEVRLFEMKPKRRSPAHKMDAFAELVCSNSLRSDAFENAVGLLKREMELLDSLIMDCARKTAVPAGGALAVDRTGFSEMITQRIRSHDRITVIEEEVTKIPEGNVVIATGPLTSDDFSQEIAALLGRDYLYFFDAAAPVLAFESIDLSKAYKAARYGKGTDDYINCPMSREEYAKFYKALTEAETAQQKEFESEKVFEGCMPVEVMAKRGEQTLLFGPLKPVGLPDPNTGKEPYAVVQLRQDNAAGTLYNIVGFQTHLKFSEQKRVFSMIPGLEHAQIERYGVMHRNTFIQSPGLLDEFFRLKKEKRISFAGQITGVEGYVESAASGLAAALYTALFLNGTKAQALSKKTALGALGAYISDETVKNFQPMNINFGIIEPLGYKVKGKKEKNTAISQRAIEELEQYIEKHL